MIDKKYLSPFIAAIPGLIFIAVYLNPSLSAHPAPALSPIPIVINEVGWMGTAASTTDEWIELYNPTNLDCNLNGWTLSAADGVPQIHLQGILTAQHYFLLERTDDQSIRDIPADQIYTGDLALNGESLILRDSLNTTIDTANGDGGLWPAGTNQPDRSMERLNPALPDTDTAWVTNDGRTRNGEDANGQPIDGTPKARNSSLAPPGLQLTLKGPSAAATGAKITYTLWISNTGDTPRANLLITDTLPAGLSFLNQESALAFTVTTDLATTWLRWELSELSPQMLKIITLSLQSSATITDPLTHTVIAAVTGEIVTASLPLIFAPPIKLYALAPASYAGSGEALALINRSSDPVSLENWCIDDLPASSSRVCFPAGATIAPEQILWLAQNAANFYLGWGFDADWSSDPGNRPVGTLQNSWPAAFFSDNGETAHLLNAEGFVIDTLVYGQTTAAPGWNGPALPYPYSGYGPGQILYRKLAPENGRPVPDTDQAADWAQDAADWINGRRLRYPGWDLEALYLPARLDRAVAVTLSVAPEGMLPLVTETIAAAQHTLRIAGYTADSQPFYEAIQERIQAGVVVTLLLESSPAGGMDPAERWLAAALHHPPTSTVYFMGKTGARYRYQHAKYIVADEARILLSTDNFGEHSLPSDLLENGTLGHRGFALSLTSPEIAARLSDLFDRDTDAAHHRDLEPYSALYAPPSDYTPIPPPDWTTYSVRFTAPWVFTATQLSLHHAPEHSFREADGLLGLIQAAGEGSRIEGMQLSEPLTWTEEIGTAGLNPRIQALIGAARRGALVRLLLDAFYDPPDNRNAETCVYLNHLARVEHLKLSCRLSNVTGLGIHGKIYLIRYPDLRSWIHLGSLNGTEISHKANREAWLQFSSSDGYVGLWNVFQQDWDLSHPPRPYQIYMPVVAQDYPHVQNLLITEVMINPQGVENNEEWFELYNPGPTVDLAGWQIGDALQTGSYRDGRYNFPTRTVMGNGQIWTIAACATAFAARYGQNPDYEWQPCAPEVPDLVPVGSWDGFGLALGNEQDELVLLASEGTIADSAAWGGSERAGVVPFTAYALPFPWQATLKRHPADRDRNDCSVDFYISFNPSPGEVSLPK